MRVPALWSALVLAALAQAPARAQQEDPPPVRFAEEIGFKAFLAHEPEEMPPTAADRTPHVQRPLYDVREWRERTYSKFALHVSGHEYYLGASVGRNLIGRFYKSGFGSEVTAFYHVDKGVDVFLAFSYGWHVGCRGEIFDQPAKLSDYSSFEFLLGVRPVIGIASLFGLDSSLDFMHLGARLGVGPAYMEDVRRIRPDPETPFWEPAALGCVHLSLTFEALLLGSLSAFFDSGVRVYSPPAAASSGRPGNETGPFCFLIWQAGLFLRF
jgi:hypothetical protein